jgi:hypothetical protein
VLILSVLEIANILYDEAEVLFTEDVLRTEELELDVRLYIILFYLPLSEIDHSLTLRSTIHRHPIKGFIPLHQALSKSATSLYQVRGYRFFLEN